MRTLVVGDIVKSTREILGNEPGALGFVYEMYDIGTPEDPSPGVSIIFENGEYDGFSHQEQDLYVTRVGRCDELAGYKFKNVMKVSQDFRDGVFDPAFA